MNKLYTEEEMIAEVCDVIESMGGTIDQIDRENHYFKISIDPYLEEEAALVVEDIINKYVFKREEVFRTNPLLRAKALRDEIYGEEEEGD